MAIEKICRAELIRGPGVTYVTEVVFFRGDSVLPKWAGSVGLLSAQIEKVAG